MNREKIKMALFVFMFGLVGGILGMLLAGQGLIPRTITVPTWFFISMGLVAVIFVEIFTGTFVLYKGGNMALKAYGVLMGLADGEAEILVDEKIVKIFSGVDGFNLLKGVKPGSDLELGIILGVGGDPPEILKIIKARA